MKNQVFQNSDDFSTMGECLKIATFHSSLLEDKGLALSNIISQIFYPALLEAINNFAKSIGAKGNSRMSNQSFILRTNLNKKKNRVFTVNNVAKYVAAEKWHSSKWVYNDPKTQQTASVPSGLNVSQSVSNLPTTGFANSLQLTDSAKYLFAASLTFVDNISHIIAFDVIPNASLFLDGFD